jgi:transposase InsO family protein
MRKRSPRYSERSGPTLLGCRARGWNLCPQPLLDRDECATHCLLEIVALADDAERCGHELGALGDGQLFPGDHDDGDVRIERIASHVLEEHDAVHLRHYDIEHYQIRRERREQPDDGTVITVVTASRAAPARALPPAERQHVLDVLHAPRFIDLAPAQVYATLLDEETYHCSERTMYRVLAAQEEVRERRAQRRHPIYAAPELLATAPNQLWSWDITKLKGPTTWSWFHLYVILDVFSRYVVGWMIASRESAVLAERLITASCERQGILRGQLTLHADRGSSTTSKPVALLLADLGVTKTHSRPHVSNDNPYSEAQFKTLKLPRRRTSARHGVLSLVQYRAPAFNGRLTKATNEACRDRQGRAAASSASRLHMGLGVRGRHAMSPATLRRFPSVNAARPISARPGP